MSPTMPHAWNHQMWYGELTEQELCHGCTVTVPGIGALSGLGRDWDSDTVLVAQRRRQRALLRILQNARYHLGLVDLVHHQPGLVALHLQRTHDGLRLTRFTSLQWDPDATSSQRAAGRATWQALVKALPFNPMDRAEVDQLYHGFEDDDEWRLTQDTSDAYLRATLGEPLWRLHHQQVEQQALRGALEGPESSLPAAEPPVRTRL